jgi:hypothetical protein
MNVRRLGVGLVGLVATLAGCAGSADTEEEAAEPTGSVSSAYITPCGGQAYYSCYASSCITWYGGSGATYCANDSWVVCKSEMPSTLPSGVRCYYRSSGPY